MDSDMSFSTDLQKYWENFLLKMHILFLVDNTALF